MNIYVSYLIVNFFTLKLMVIYKAFALTGRFADCHYNPGCCPGLGAFALSGRIADIYLLLPLPSFLP